MNVMSAMISEVYPTAAVSRPWQIMLIMLCSYASYSGFNDLCNTGSKAQSVKQK